MHIFLNYIHGGFHWHRSHAVWQEPGFLQNGCLCAPGGLGPVGSLVGETKNAPWKELDSGFCRQDLTGCVFVLFYLGDGELGMESSQMTGTLNLNNGKQELCYSHHGSMQVNFLVKYVAWTREL